MAWSLLSTVTASLGFTQSVKGGSSALAGGVGAAPLVQVPALGTLGNLFVNRHLLCRPLCNCVWGVSQWVTCRPVTCIICPLGPLSPFTPECHHATPGLETEAKQKSCTAHTQRGTGKGRKTPAWGAVAAAQPQKSPFPLRISNSVAREMSLAWKPVAGREGY